VLTNPATILVLEKSAASSELIEQTLRESGDRVFVTNNPVEGLELARRIRIDLLVSDIGLTGGPEKALLEQLRSVQQGFRVVYLNGQDDSAQTLTGGEVTLRAPFSLEALVDAVSRVLGRRI
jgi:DNA-binding response OmpR family regulator